jgi:hypothetical protein
MDATALSICPRNAMIYPLSSGTILGDVYHNNALDRYTRNNPADISLLGCNAITLSKQILCLY